MKRIRLVLGTRVAGILLAILIGSGTFTGAYSRVVTTGDSNPSAKFLCIQSCKATAGSSIQFIAKSTAAKPDYSWDLNGDNTFGDAVGDTAVFTFTQPGSYSVGLLTTDLADKQQVTVTRTITILKGVSAPTPTVTDTFDAADAGKGIKDDRSGLTFPHGAVPVFPRYVVPSSYPLALAALNGASSFQACLPGPALEVSLNAGLDSKPAPKGGLWARLAAYDAGGKEIASSPDIQIAEEGKRANVDTPLAVESRAVDISCVGIFMGQGTKSHDTAPRPALIDDLTAIYGLPDLTTPWVTIDTPADGTSFPPGHRPSFVSGRLWTQHGIRHFCVLPGDAATAPDWTTCNQHLTLPGHETIHNGMYAVSTPLTLHTGDNTFTAWLQDINGRIAHDSATITLQAPPPHMYDLGIAGIEVTQAVQPEALPTLDFGVSSPLPGITHSFRVGHYSGVILAAGKKTIVRVYPQATDIPAGFPIGGRLYGFFLDAHGHLASLGSPIGSDNGTVYFTPYTGGIPAVRSRTDDSLTFTLPVAWTRADLVELVAQLIPPPDSSTMQERTDENNVAGLMGIDFIHTNSITITPAAEFMTRPRELHPASDAVPLFDGLKAITPVADSEFTALPYAGSFDVSGLRDWTDGFDLAMGLVHVITDALITGFCRGCPGNVIGVFPSTLDAEFPHHSLTLVPPLAFTPTAAVQDTRPLQGVAHEFGHVLGRAHASGACGGAYAFGIGAEGWPPDERGQLQGVGLDSQPSHMTGPGGYRVFYPGRDGHSDSTGQEYDYMSYCVSDRTSTEMDTWVSPKGWTELFNILTRPVPLAARLARSHTAAANLRVLAAVKNGKATIVSVIPTTQPASAAGNGDAEYQLAVLDSKGSILASYPADPQQLHVDRQPGTIMFSVIVPAASANEVDLIHFGKVIASRTRPTLPTVTLFGPKPGTTVDGKGNVTVSWKVDGMKDLTPEAFIRYSADGGKTYTMIGLTYGPSSISLPGRLFSHSDSARLQLVVSDGWDLVATTSGPFKATGTPPFVDIRSIGAKESISRDAELFLDGTAADDTNGVLSGKSLVWQVNGKTVGYGTTLSVGGLPVGNDTVILSATDGRGRTSTATATVQVFAPKPPSVAMVQALLTRHAR